MDDPRKERMESELSQRLAEASERYGPTLESIDAQQSMLVDELVPLSGDAGMRFMATPETVVASVGRPVTATDPDALRDAGIEGHYPMSPHAIAQVADRLGLPSKYTRESISSGIPWRRDLIAHAMTEHANNKPQTRVLVRRVGNTIRGVLSDRYRRLDSGTIARSFITAGSDAGMRLLKADADDTQTSVEMIYPQVFQIDAGRNGIAWTVYGARYRNSDFGDGAMSISLMEIRCLCFNLLVFERAMREIHLGKRLPENVRFSEKTYRLDTQTTASAVADTVGQLITPDAIQERAEAVQRAASTEVKLDDEIKRLPSLQKGESESLIAVLARNRIDEIPDGPLTRFKLAQGVSFVAQGSNTARRRRDLEELAATLVN